VLALLSRLDDGDGHDAVVGVVSELACIVEACPRM